MTAERPEAFTFFGPRALLGPELKPGDAAPPFSILDGKFQPHDLSEFAGKPLLISVVPSLDTGVCTKQTMRFNKEAASLSAKANFLAVSADLPFAQARWCGANDVTHMQAFSDHRDMSFGMAYGTMVKDLRIDSRAVFVIDGSGIVRFAEYVPVAGEEPDYDAALAALKEVI